MEKITLSDGEWKLMDLLWQEPPKTITQLTKDMESRTGWGRNVIITMLKRLEAKGAVRHEEGERAKQFYPAVTRQGAALDDALKTARSVHFTDKAWTKSDSMVKSE